MMALNDKSGPQTLANTKCTGCFYNIDRIKLHERYM